MKKMIALLTVILLLSSCQAETKNYQYIVRIVPVHITSVQVGQPVRGYAEWGNLNIPCSNDSPGIRDYRGYYFDLRYALKPGDIIESPVGFIFTKNDEGLRIDILPLDLSSYRVE